MAGDGTQYETKTVRVVRGLEARTIAKWQGQGWEFVSQSPGRLKTDIVIRRPKKKLPNGLYAAVAAVALLLFAVVGFGALSEQDDTDASSEPTTTSNARGEVTSSSGNSSAATSSVAGQDTTPAEPAVLTPKSNADLASILKLGDYCDSSIEKFAKKYRGQALSLDASIDAMNNHGSSKTRYDILLSEGPYSETTSRGPAFQFRDVNTTSDLHHRGEVPDSIGVGSNLSIKAEVKEYEAESCLFLLEPIETTFLPSR